MASNNETLKGQAAVGLGTFRAVIVFLFLVSGVINILALTGAFYMLQIYDRALTSRSIETLILISGLAIGLYMFQGLLDVMRSQILVRAGARADFELAPLAHRVAIDMPRFGYSPAEAGDRVRDVDTLRQFVSGQGPLALLDLPWMPIYLAFIYLLHPFLAVLVIAGAVVLAALTLTTELLTRRASNKTQKAAVARAGLVDSHLRNVEVMRSMGFVGSSVERFDKANREHLQLQMRTSDVVGTLSGVSKVIRMMLQSAVLGLGAYFTINGELTAGAIIAASVASARALAPIDMVIAHWKGLVAARRSYRRLKETVATLDKRPRLVDLPPPQKSLKVERITVAAPGSGNVVLSDVSFELQAGQALGLIGPSGSGKSSLARALTGVWPLVRGGVRFDGADISQWEPDALGPHIGYLPQDVSLMDGSVAENICRFSPDPNSLSIIAAAHAAGVHELILRLAEGYETRLGSTGTALSAGQRQRIALARALFGMPFLIVLDEPNSNLDTEGETALSEAISTLKAAGKIVIVIAHRPSALRAVDFLAVMQNGRLTAFGPKDEILAAPQPKPELPATAARLGTGEPRWAQSKI